MGRRADWVEVPGLRTVPHRAGPALVGGASNAGGLFVNWARQLRATLTTPRWQRRTSPAVVWEPYVRGERTPLHDPHRRRAVRPRRRHGDRATWCVAYEASGHVLRHHLDLAWLLDGSGTTGQRAQRLVLTGGGVRVPMWPQALADVTGLPADVVAVPEGGAVGAAYLARRRAADASGASRWASTTAESSQTQRCATRCWRATPALHPLVPSTLRLRRLALRPARHRRRRRRRLGVRRSRPAAVGLGQGRRHHLCRPPDRGRPRPPGAVLAAGTELRKSSELSKAEASSCVTCRRLPATPGIQARLHRHARRAEHDPRPAGHRHEPSQDDVDDPTTRLRELTQDAADKAIALGLEQCRAGVDLSSSGGNRRRRRRHADRGPACSHRRAD
ncbi:MAG: FGGY-family carbohydrate kinase [Acidimicrobiales bacterium]